MLTDENLPRLTVLVDAIDNTDGLERHLPAILTQDYPEDFEVVVVTEQDNPAAEAIVKHYEKAERFRSTFIPADTLFLSRHKLAVTLGVKAARNEWVVMVDADCAPVSDEWLKALASQISAETDLLVGYCNYETTTRRYRRYLQFRNAVRFLHAGKRPSAHCSCGANVVFRKSLFMQQRPYEDNLQHEFGEYDFLVSTFPNKRSKQRTQLCLAEEALVVRDEPTNGQWRHNNMVGINVRRHLRGFAWTVLKSIGWHVLSWAYFLMAALLVAFGLISEDWIMVGGASVALIVAVALSLCMAQRTVRLFHEQFSAWRLVFLYKPSLVFHDVAEFFRYQKSNKQKFNTHKP